MAQFFDRLDLDDAERIERLSRLAYELRENGKALLDRHGAETPAMLLESIKAGVCAEHPAYEDYLGAQTIEELRQAVREELALAMREARPL